MGNMTYVGLFQALKRQLDKAWPDCGASEVEVRMAHFLDPRYKGLFLKLYGKYDATLRDLVSML
jgi:hypothetical protein